VTRWNRRLLLGAIALLVPALAGCEAGFDAPTLTFHPAANGATATVRGVSIINAFVLGPGLNSELPAGGQAGVFLSIEAPDGDRLVSASAPGAATKVAITGGSVNLPRQSVVDLSGPDPDIVLTGLTSALGGGETINLVFIFAEAGVVTLRVPVEPRAYEYITFAPPPAPTPSPAASGTISASPSATP
jgi:copper(I)-binding protein